MFTFLYFSFLEGVSIDPLTSVGFLYILQEIAIGVILGFSLQLVSAAITVGGQAISNAMGLGMANMFDPNLGKCASHITISYYPLNINLLTN